MENFELDRELRYRRERNISNLVSSCIVTQLIQYVDFYYLKNHTINTNHEHQLFKHFPEDETPLTYKSFMPFLATLITLEYTLYWSVGGWVDRVLN